MNADEVVNRLREYAKRCDGVHSCWNAPTLLAAADLIKSLHAQLAEEKITSQALRNAANGFKQQLAASQRRERAHEAAIKRHYADMTSQCFICYSCVNHDARQKAKWDGKKLEDYACSGCGDGKPNWKFDVERFMGQEGRK